MKLAKREIQVGFGVGLGLLVVVAWLSYITTRQLVETSRQVSHTHKVLVALEEIVTSLQDVQRGERGYVITGDNRFLEPYHAGVEKIEHEIADLKRLTADNPAQQERLLAVELLVASALVEFREAVDARRTQGLSAATAVVQAGDGKKLMDEIRQRIDEMKRVEGELLQQRETQAQATAGSAILVVTLGTALSSSLFLTVFYFLNREIDERRRAEQALARRAQELDRFFTLSLDPICIAGFDGYFKRLNPAWEAVLGFSRDELLAKPYLDFVHPDDRAATEAQSAKVNAGEVVISFENRYRCKDGSYRWLLWKAVPVLDDQLVYAAARDITQRKEVEARLERVNAELGATNKELETFTYSVSHDLRAPLRHVAGFSRILLEDHAAQLNPDAQHCVARVQQGVEQMGMLVDDLLNLSRISRQELRRQITGLTPLVEQTVQQLSAETQGRPMEWRLQPLPFADCDPALMKQVFANLLSNAVKFTRTRLPAVIEVGADTRNGEPVLFVRDNGVGFPMKYAGKLFGVFQRLHRQEDFEGTGVGLAIVHRILTKHGSRIWAEGELDKGATFFFTLGAAESLESPAEVNPQCTPAK